MARMDFKSDKKLRKIPIIISHWNDNGCKGWRAEISYDYEDYKPKKAEDINFEDLTHHFQHDTETHHLDHLVFYKKRDALECAKHVNEKFLNGKGKIYNC